MKQSSVFLACVCLLAAACGSSTGYSRGGMANPGGMALTDDYLFITSTDTNDLRVMKLTINNAPTQRQFVPAPNPLEALSIPTITRPTDIVVDDYWVDGRVVHGDYLYVSRPGGAEFSVVGALETEFREVTRMVAPAPITATAAVRLDSSSRFYFGVSDGRVGTLYSVDVPTDRSTLRALTPAQRTALIKSVVSVGSDSVTALTVVPGLEGRTVDGAPFCADVSKHCVVVATRRAGGAEGQTLMIDPDTLRTVNLAFPGPVRLLVTHGQTTFFDEAQGEDFVALRAGQRVFAILDEEKCGNSTCGGVIAVDTRTALSSQGGFPIALDRQKLPMLPLIFSDALPVGLSLLANPTTQPRNDLGTVTRLPSIVDGGVVLTAFSLLGVATSANGQITFFDGANLRQIDGTPEAAYAFNAQMFDNNGFTTPYVTGLDAGTDENLIGRNIKLADGVWRTQAISIYWEGVVSELPIILENGPTTTLSVPAQLLSRVMLKDNVVFLTGAAACADAPIIGIGESSVTIAAIPPDCANAGAFLIRAGPDAPFAIFRTQLPQYMGRAKPGEEFTYDAPVYVRLGNEETYVAPAHALSMGFGLDTIDAGVARGSSWQFTVASAYAPYTFVIDASSVGCGGLQLPGQVVFDQPRARMYVVYPSGNSVIDVDPGNAQRLSVGTLNNTYCYN